jgi:hypothetical protein
VKQTYLGAGRTADCGLIQRRDGNTMHASGILGWGDLATDGYNICATLVPSCYTSAVLGAASVKEPSCPPP